MMTWWVFLQDTNGSRRFVGTPYNFVDEESAKQRIDEIESRQNKAHKVDYWKVEHAGCEQSVRTAYSIEG